MSDKLRIANERSKGLQFWSIILSQCLEDVLEKDADIDSPEFNRQTPLRFTWHLVADFECCSCHKTWDSTQVPVEFQYDASINTFGRQCTFDGKISIVENGQKCRNGCIEIYESPAFDPEAGKLAAMRLKEKILEKYYGVPVPITNNKPHNRGPRNGPHDVNNCEGCDKGLCFGIRKKEEFYARKKLPIGPGFMKATRSAYLRPDTIKWSLTVGGETCILEDDIALKFLAQRVKLLSETMKDKGYDVSEPKNLEVIEEKNIKLPVPNILPPLPPRTQFRKEKERQDKLKETIKNVRMKNEEEITIKCKPTHILLSKEKEQKKELKEVIQKSKRKNHQEARKTYEPPKPQTREKKVPNFSYMDMQAMLFTNASHELLRPIAGKAVREETSGNCEKCGNFCVNTNFWQRKMCRFCEIGLTVPNVRRERRYNGNRYNEMPPPNDKPKEVIQKSKKRYHEEARRRYEPRKSQTREKRNPNLRNIEFVRPEREVRRMTNAMSMDRYSNEHTVNKTNNFFNTRNFFNSTRRENRRFQKSVATVTQSLKKADEVSALQIPVKAPSRQRNAIKVEFYCRDCRLEFSDGFSLDVHYNHRHGRIY